MAELLEPEPEHAKVLMALGRVLIAAGSMEAVVLLEIARLRTEAGESLDETVAVVNDLRNKPAGKRIDALKAAGAEPALIRALRDAVKQRNEVVHHLLTDPLVIAGIAGGDTQALLRRLDGVALQCGTVIESMAASAFSGMAAILGVEDLGGLVEAAASIDTDELPTREREFLQALQNLSPKQLEALANPAG